MMKKNIRILIMTALASILISCGMPETPDQTVNGQENAVEAESTGTEAESTGAEAESTEDGLETVDYEELRKDMESAAVANPWGDTQSLDVATGSSGVDFIPPDESNLPGDVSLVVYRYMEGVIEARYEGGEDKLIIRKSNDIRGNELSGDYNNYSDEWDESISGIEVHCAGADGRINTATYDAQGSHFAIMYNIGDEENGLEAGELQKLMEVEDDKTEAYTFRTPELRLSHFTKHGIDMGFTTEEAYEQAASRVITNPNALHKIEAEDGDDVYYVEATNEFVVLSTDGYIRTYFNPDRGKAYFDKQ